MIKKISKALGIAVPVGITVGLVISLFFSRLYGAAYAPSTPSFMAHFNASTTAMAVSLLLWALMGAVFGLTPLVFQLNRLSLGQQTVLHFILTFCLFTPLAILAGWFPLTLTWLIGFAVDFVVIYLIIWGIDAWRIRRYVMRANAKLK